MEQVVLFFSKLFATANWPPRWHCGQWTDFDGWFYIVSDLLIWSAYFAIPLTLVRYVSRYADPRFTRTAFLLAAFFLAGGATHLLDALLFWFPAYRFSGLLRFVAGVISWITVFHLVRILPRASSLQSHAELQTEIAERRKVEEDLKLTNQQLNAAQEIARLGHWQWNVPENKVTWSNQLYKIYGQEPGTDISYESYLQKLHPDDRDFVHATVQKAFAEKKFPSFIHRIRMQDGWEKIIQSRGDVITNDEGEVIMMIGTAQDITEVQKAQQQLEERTQALEITNAELQRFAYVASHDLQEPLRKSMTFASLLQKELGGDMSEKAVLYMNKIIQSSSRMQRLIDDILAFSSITATGETFPPTDLNLILQHVLSDMEIPIEQAGATVKADRLPPIDAIGSQMGQLFQNLVSNALKFRKEGLPPVITITAKLVGVGEVKHYAQKNEKIASLWGQAYNWSREQFLRLEVTDNGMGFEPGYAEKIFEIFQRLHSTNEVTGTGIGLAICKKIVDNHHGIITAKGQPGKGATFVIFLPVSQKHFRELA